MGGITCLGIWLAAILLVMVSGHGRLEDPPGRASMWRFGYETKPDYSDNQLSCGGRAHEMEEGERCGICGDPYDERQPRTHEIGGPYYRGYLVRNYTAGQVITVTVDLTVSHMGYFQFKICPVQGFKTEATQECLDKGILEIAGTGSTDYHIGNEPQIFHVDVQLPANLECEHCVFQWRYHTGNSWGICPNGTGMDGCGPQEEFYGCADVSVHPSGAPTPVHSPPTSAGRNSYPNQHQQHHRGRGHIATPEDGHASWETPNSYEPLPIKHATDTGHHSRGAHPAEGTTGTRHQWRETHLAQGTTGRNPHSQGTHVAEGTTGRRHYSHFSPYSRETPLTNGRCICTRC